MTIINQVLEYLYNPNWLKYFIFFMCVFVALYFVVSAWMVGRTKRLLPLALREQQFLLGKMAWLRGSSNFFLLVGIFALIYPKIFYLRSPNFHIAMNLVVAFAVLAAVLQYLRALTIKRRLTRVE